MIAGPPFHKGDEAITQIYFNKEYHKAVQINLWKCKLSMNHMQKLSKINYPNLNILFLNYNTIGAKGCKYLSRISLPNIQMILLGQNMISSEGALHVSKSQWPNLQQIKIWTNKMAIIDDILYRGNWCNMQTLDFDQNKLTKQQIMKLMTSEWKQFNNLTLQKNNVEYYEKLSITKIFLAKFPNGKLWL